MTKIERVVRGHFFAVYYQVVIRVDSSLHGLLMCTFWGHNYRCCWAREENVLEA